MLDKLNQPKGSTIGVLRDGRTIQEAFDGIASASALRTTEPVQQGQRITISQVDSESGPMSGGEFWYDAADTSSIHNGITVIVTPSGKRWKRVENYIDLSWFGIKGSKNFADAWDTAVSLVDNYVRTVGFDGRPAIFIPQGNYTAMRTLNLPSYVSVVAMGNVAIADGGLDDNSFLLRIANTVAGINTTHHAGWNLGAVGGTFRLNGRGRTGAVDGLYVGGSSGTSDVRNVSLYGVAVYDFRNLLTFGSINTYLFTATKCHLETCQIALNIPNTTSSNSGEKMVFNDTVLGGANTGTVSMSTPGMDITFNGCSFDFTSGNVFKGNPTWGYSRLTVNNCHIEGHTGLLISVDAPQGGGIGSNRSIIMSNIVYLPRQRSNTAGTNSPSRLKIDAKSTPIFINGLTMRHEVVPYTEDPFMASLDSNLTVTGYVADAFMCPPSREYLLNRGFDVADETIGTAVNSADTLDALTRFTCIERSAMSALVAAGGSVGKVINMTGAGGYFKMTTKEFIPVDPRQRVGVYAALSMGMATGSINITPSVVWYDAAGAVISTSGGTISTNMRPVFENATLPNYAEGNSRFIASTPMLYRAPVGAVKCKPQWLLSGWSGVVGISRLAAFTV